MRNCTMKTTGIMEIWGKNTQKCPRWHTSTEEGTLGKMAAQCHICEKVKKRISTSISVSAYLKTLTLASQRSVASGGWLSGGRRVIWSETRSYKGSGAWRASPLGAKHHSYKRTSFWILGAFLFLWDTAASHDALLTDASFTGTETWV